MSNVELRNPEIQFDAHPVPQNKIVKNINIAIINDPDMNKFDKIDKMDALSIFMYSVSNKEDDILLKSRQIL